jgi:hypothetical protein
MWGRSSPHAALLVPFLAVGAEALQPNAAPGLVELQRGDGARGGDGFDLVTGRCTMRGRMPRLSAADRLRIAETTAVG